MSLALSLFDYLSDRILFYTLRVALQVAKVFAVSESYLNDVVLAYPVLNAPGLTLFLLCCTIYSYNC